MVIFHSYVKLPEGKWRHRCPKFPLVEKNRGVSSEPPEKQQVCLMVGILVGALEHDFLFSHIFRIIIPPKIN
jgi:hypothetical protein